MASLTIEQYLSGKVDFNVPADAIAVILADNNVDTGATFSSLTQKQKDLCLADLYLWLATSSSQSGLETESDGGWSRTRAAKNVVDRSYFRSLANTLYTKWNSDKAEVSSGRMTMRNLY